MNPEYRHPLTLPPGQRLWSRCSPLCIVEDNAPSANSRPAEMMVMTRGGNMCAFKGQRGMHETTSSLAKQSFLKRKTRASSEKNTRNACTFATIAEQNPQAPRPTKPATTTQSCTAHPASCAYTQLSRLAAAFLQITQIRFRRRYSARKSTLLLGESGIAHCSAVKFASS